MTYAQRKAALRDWFKTELRRVTNLPTLPVIFDEQAKPRPKPPYASLKFINPTIRIGGTDEMSSVGRLLEMRASRRSFVSFQFFGPNAVDVMSQVRDTLDQPNINDIFRAAGMAHERESDVRDLSALLETKYEERAQFDVTFAYVENRRIDVSTIEAVEIEGTIVSDSENEIEQTYIVGTPDDVGP